jgi:hypothetical protein
MDTPGQQPATPPTAPVLPQTEPTQRARVQRSGSLRQAPPDRTELPEQTAEERVAGLLNPKLKGVDRNAEPRDDEGGEPEDDRPSRRESTRLKAERDDNDPAPDPDAPRQPEQVEMPDSLDDTAEQQAGEEGDPWEEMEYTAPNGRKYIIPKPLVDGAMMQADYTKGKESIAAERRFNAAFKQQLEIDGTIQTQLGPAISQLQQMDQQIQQLSLQKRQPGITVEAFVELDKQIAHLTDSRDQFRVAVGNHSTKLSAEKQAAVTALQSAADQYLSKTLPKWSSPAVKRAVEQRIADQGFTPEEISQMYDPRWIAIAHDAALYQKIKGKRDATVRQVQQAAPVVRPQGRASNATTETQQTGRLKVQAQRSGKPADAEEAITRMLKSARSK